MIYVVSAFTAMLACFILVCHCKYDDGIIGRSALLPIIVAEMVVVAQYYFEGVEPEIATPHGILQVSFAVFITRHTYRFLMFHYTGKSSWSVKNAKGST